MAHAGTPDSEWRTRKRLIDPRLRAAGRKVMACDPAHPFGKGSPVAIEEFPTDNGPADYALCVEGQLLGVVEAKKLTLGPQNALTQAERYSRGATQSPLNFHGFRVPFLYSTNGEVLWHHDVRHPQSRSRRNSGDTIHNSMVTGSQTDLGPAQAPSLEEFRNWGVVRLGRS